jgi:hypothetical protein
MTEVTGRDPNSGRFTTGNPGGPGRPRREQEQATLQAITSAIPPEEVTSALRTALDLAVELRSPRAIIAVLEFQASYQLGKPVARVENAGELDPISAALEQMRQIHMEAAERAQQVAAASQ